MGYLPNKTLEDLEFFEVTKQIADFAITPLGKAACLEMTPLPDSKAALDALHGVSEYRASFDNDNRIPNHGFEDLSQPNHSYSYFQSSLAIKDSVTHS